jgi:predicted ATPase/signal transduction histidine kinase/CheY-like chemotaxis protein
MAAPPGYEIRERVHSGARSTVLRARRLSSRENVVLKLSSGASSSSAFARSQHELSVAAPILSPHVVRYFGVERYDDHVALVEEEFGNCSLEALLQKQRLDVDVVLELGAQIAGGLAAIHDYGVVHCAIHPGNIVVDTVNWRAKIIDFADASLLPERPDASDVDVAVVPLAYISPEHTGRMNRKVDYRTDFYSLGAVLYHALSGRPPFGDADPLALVHAHLARAHRALAAVDGAIPVQVSKLIDKLLAKNPEDRYQSARGIVADLEECARQYRASGSVDAFPLGRSDLPETFLIPQKLYGRSAERAQLLDAFAKVARGKKLLFLVEGYAGSGKSSLVNEIQRPVLEQRGTFVRGKFDPLMRQAPYSALAQALRQLCRGLLGLSEAELAACKTRIVAGVTKNAGLIVDIVPELERILGPQPPVPKAGLLESQHRFELTLARFLSAFARENHPLVLFLDDLQWADPATLHALAALLRLPEPTSLLVIGAYRDNEIDSAHPLSIVLEEIRRGRTELRSVTLGGLPEADLRLFVADTVRRAPSEVRELADRAVEKTSGNPFFVAEFLRTLHEERLLLFSPETRAWTWEPAKIDALAITPNVVDLVLRKLQRLPPATLSLLRLAAAAGDGFDLLLLAAAAKLPAAVARADLAPAIRERLVVPLDPNYPIGLVDVSSESVSNQPNYWFRFLHDRVQQAAYETIDAAARPALHLQLGRILRTRATREGFGERIFDVVDQLNRGADLIRDLGERIELAKLNLEAGDRARRTTAYGEAREYLRRGIGLLPEAAWSEEYVLTSLLHLRYAECAYLAGEFEEAEAFSNALLPKLRTPLEKAELYSIGIVLETSRNRYTRALELSRAALAVLGHPAPPADSSEALSAASERLARSVRGRKIDELAQLPELKNAKIGAVVRILAVVYGPAYLGDPNGLFVWAVHENLRLAIEHGTTAATAVGYTYYGMHLIARERDYEGAMAFGRLALALAERDDAFPLRCRIHEVTGVSSNAYAGNHIKTSVPLLKRAMEFGLESGDLFYTCLAATVLPGVRFMAGENLDEVCREAESCERSISSFRHDQMIVALRIFRQTVRCLRGETHGRTSLATDDLDEETLFAEMQSIGQMTRPFHSMYQVILRTLLGDYAHAVQAILESDQAIEASTGALILFTEYGFFACLALLEARRMPQLDQRAIRRKLREKRALLARWAESAPVNFRHKRLLVSAELAELEGRRVRATRLYEEAMRDASANGFHQHAALASELAGRAYERRGLPEVARAYRLAARAGYAKWGAIGKVRALDEDHPDLLPKAMLAAVPPLPLDAISLVRASQALSSEIDLGALVERILRVIIQASGAERGSLLVEDNGRLELEAFLDPERAGVEIHPDPTLLPKPFSEAIVRYTERTGDDVVLADASREGDFTRDPYVVARSSKSVLCMAVRHRDRVTGVMFLENTLATDVFTRERLEMLRLLVAQAAISLENARLYAATRRLNRELGAREALLRDFFEALPVGIYVVDADGGLSFTNRAASAIVGGTVDPELGASQPLFPEPYVAGTDRPYPECRIPLSRALEGETSMVDDIELRLAERSVPLAIWGTPILGDDGAVRYAILAFQDISAQRAAEAARARLEEQLHQAERLESIGRLAGGVAHDFNNLLTPILVYSELAAQALPEESLIQEEISGIRAAAAQAAELTKQLLAFGGKEVLDARVVDLNRELAYFEMLLRRVLRENVRIELDLAPGLGLVRADPSQIQRIVMNLALNAADAMQEGGLLRIRTANVERQAQASDDGAGPFGACVALSVSDNGHGMDRETLARIFDPFFTTKRPGEGTGLGLPTVYGLVQQHGGKLTVESAPGEGTCFEVLLPRVFDDTAKPEKPPGPIRAPEPVGSLVLVVEDDSAVRSVLHRILRREGYQVIAAADPAEALEIAHGLERPIDLLVTDVVMPVMNGRELYTELSQTQPSLAVLFLSGYPRQVLSDKGWLDPGIDLLPKPVAVSTLTSRVREILARRATVR